MLEAKQVLNHTFQGVKTAAACSQQHHRQTLEISSLLSAASQSEIFHAYTHAAAWHITGQDAVL
jgi:hypothetical protein